MDHSINEKYNLPENVDGKLFMILLGSKVIKESYDIKAVRYGFIMRRPYNISTLIQIRGRMVRKGSHELLPEDKRNVKLMIFTSCCPERQKSGIDKGKFMLGYEEIKYKEKINIFKKIQDIEKILHEVAVDNPINALTNQQESNDPLGALKFNSRRIPASKMNISTFTTYHENTEIDLCKYIIKRCFIELSSVWTHKDLFTKVRNPHFDIDTDTELISENSFLIAVYQLCWSDDKFSIDKHVKNIIDSLFDPTDRIIYFPNATSYYIVPIYDKTQYYILFPIKNGKPEIDVEITYRNTNLETRHVIGINNFVQNKKIDFDYDDKKKLFYKKYADTQIENMENIVCEYGNTFHIKFLDECIEYIFGVWCNPKVKKSLYHDFYFKMLYYYDLLSLVIWAYTCKPKVFKDYVDYAIPVHAKDIKIRTLNMYEKREEELAEITPDNDSDLGTSGIINLLRTSINRSSNAWIPQEFRKQFNKTLADSVKLFAGDKKKTRHIHKVSAINLPIGHFISKFPRLYHPDRGWTEDPTYIQNDQNYVENNLIVGYDERSKTGVHIRFKLRAPSHNITKHKDSRLIERGTVCSSKSRNFLLQIAKKLGMEINKNINIIELCSTIRSKLIRNELKERIKKTNIKYFYFHYEQQERTT